LFFGGVKVVKLVESRKMKEERRKKKEERRKMKEER